MSAHLALGVGDRVGSYLSVGSDRERVDALHNPITHYRTVSVQYGGVQKYRSDHCTFVIPLLGVGFSPPPKLRCSCSQTTESERRLYIIIA